MTPVREEGQRNSARKPNPEPTGRSQGRVGQVLSAIVVDDNADGEIRGRDDRLTDVQRSVVELGLPHLADDVEECWSSGIGD